jgi:ferredoxin
LQICLCRFIAPRHPDRKDLLMKGILCYYSGTGNTKLACEYLAENVGRIELTLNDLVRDRTPDFGEYDIAGFATFADWLGPPQFFRDMIAAIPVQKQKAAFVLNTFGNFNGRTLKMMVDLVRSRGFGVVAAHALHMPENVPTMTTSPLANRQAPNRKELKAFQRFFTQLTDLAANPVLMQDAVRRYRHPWPDNLMPTIPRWVGIAAMGTKKVDAALCNGCTICIQTCPYKAISMTNGKPVFDQKRCHGCWACYNKCPQRAIYTRMYRGAGHYPRPIDPLLKKLPVAGGAR